MIYLFTVICGLCSVMVFLPLMLRESRKRRLDAIRMIHTDFVGINCDLREHISATELTIGRRKKRCDICLIDVIKQKADGAVHESAVSQVHARLRWDGSSFRIAPVWTYHIDRTCSRPKVWVNMIPVDKEKGVRVDYGDVITISDDMYKFTLVDTGCHASVKTRARRAVTRKTRRRRNPLFSSAAVLAALVLLVAAAGFGFARSMVMPEAANPPGERKDDTATFLICGVDRDGVRTDTMMLVYVSGSENKIGLLSIPRDTITRNAKGNMVKLNAIYAGRGEAGAEDLMQYVSQYIGYMPDGYLVFDWALVEEITDLMGGVDVTLDHHIRVHTDGEEVFVDKGEQHLNGKQMLATLRYRYGYADADLGRVKVQRQVISACVDQWVALSNIPLVPEAMELLKEKSVTNLSPENLLWIGKTVLMSRGDMTSATLKGYPEYYNGLSYYFLSPRAIVEQINEAYNPYLVDITREDLSVVELS